MHEADEPNAVVDFPDAEFLTFRVPAYGHALERRDLGLVFLKKVSRSGVFSERAGLKLLDPGPDQVARNVVAFRETVERLAGNDSSAICA